MKVGILTFHNAHNYGAVLQAYALKRKLTEMGHPVEILNYQNRILKRKYSSKLNMQIKMRDMLHPRLVFDKVQFIRNIPKYQFAWERQCDNFEKFIWEYLLEENEWEYTFEQIGNTQKDIYIAGSDQIWTSGLTGGLDKAYLLDFPTKARKISYAASIYGGNIPEREQTVFKRCLADFAYISVREEKLAASIYEKCGYHAETVLDPTLLIDADQYMPLISKKNLCSYKYVLAYFVTDAPELVDFARYISDKLYLKLIEIHYYKKEANNENYIADAGPAEFLWYVKNAKYVITNSFHGTIFSILFQKDFYSIYADDTRMDNLLNKLGLASRHLPHIDKDISLQNVDYRDVDQKLCMLRETSEEFLKKSMQ